VFGWVEAGQIVRACVWERDAGSTGAAAPHFETASSTMQTVDADEKQPLFQRRVTPRTALFRRHDRLKLAGPATPSNCLLHELGHRLCGCGVGKPFDVA